MPSFEPKPGLVSDQPPASSAPPAVAALPLSQLSAIVVDLAHRTRADVGSLTITGPDGDVAQISTGTDSLYDAVVRAPESWTFVSQLIRTGLNCAGWIDAEDQSLGVPEPAAVLRYGFGAGVRPPGHLPGALCIGFAVTPPRSIRRETLWTVERYAGLAALCLHDADRLDGLLASGRLDGLTGCLNHRAIHSELNREIQLSARSGRPVSCCFIDLDHFKRVNDMHGHEYGSRVLAKVAAVLRDNLRLGDALGRYGGDEFVAVLPDTDQHTALLLAERLRVAVSEAVTIGSGERLGLSVGIGQSRSGTRTEELLSVADDALLTAKRAGGARVVASPV